jgi:Fe-S-cluster containining protein
MSQEKKPLRLEDDFTFACHKGLACYTSCCRDVNIFLTPYDVLRLKNALGMSSTEFLEKHTDLVVVPSKQLPLIQFRMNEDNDKKCYFVRENGCLHYQHRPWACRMFPLDEAGPGGYAVIATGERCHGLVEGDKWNVKEWLMDQGATQSKEMDGSYDALSAHEFMRSLDVNNEKVQQMIIMAIYDVDRFRKFVFESSFLERFDIDDERVEVIKNDDVAMLDLGYDWVRFGLLGQKTLNIREEAKAKAQAMAQEIKQRMEQEDK